MVFLNFDLKILYALDSQKVIPAGRENLLIHHVLKYLYLSVFNASHMYGSHFRYFLTSVHSEKHSDCKSLTEFPCLHRLK